MVRSDRQGRDAERSSSRRQAPAGHTPRRDAPAAVAAEDTGYRGQAAPPAPAPVWSHRVYVERPAELAKAAAHLRSARVIALDAEFSQPRVRTPDEPAHRLAVLQLADDDDYDTSYVIDTQRLSDLTPLEPLFADHGILKLFHGIGADARVLATRDLVAQNTLDLEAVSRSIFGQRESGLQAMLQRACGIRLDKSWQRADWSRRPLNPAMIAYAARDAETTFALYGWLTMHYSWAVALHETAGAETPPPVAEWIRPYLEGSRPKAAALAVAEAGIANDAAAQGEALRVALAVVRHPNQRSRVMRLITDLDLTRLAPDLRPYLASPASEERAGAARGIGRLHNRSAIELVRPLLDDAVYDVRQAAKLATESLTGVTAPRRPRPTASAERREGPLMWTSGADEGESASQGGWRAALRARFSVSAKPQRPPSTRSNTSGTADGHGEPDDSASGNT